MAKKIESYFEAFSSPHDFMQKINNRADNGGFRGSSRSVRDDDWAGTSTYEEAQELFLRGDKENAKKIQQCQLSAKIKSGEQLRKTFARSVAGATPIVPLVTIGVPNNMLRQVRTTTKTRIMHLVINTGVSCNVDAEQVIRASAKIMQIVCTLEKHGTRIALYASNFACANSSRNFQTLGFIVKIKNAGAPLNKLMAAYPFINPGFQRWHGFRFRETAPVRIGGGWRQYGCSKTASQETPELKNYFRNTCFKVINISELIGYSRKGYSTMPIPQLADELLK